jgi:hypothetical protein
MACRTEGSTLMPKASVNVRSVKVTPVDPDAQPFLYVDLHIECDVCGETRGQVFGHHLKTLHKALGLIIEANPGLVGEAGEVASTLEFEGMAPGSGKESMN